jgi:hypothetical protein
MRSRVLPRLIDRACKVAARDGHGDEMRRLPTTEKGPLQRADARFTLWAQCELEVDNPNPGRAKERQFHWQIA